MGTYWSRDYFDWNYWPGDYFITLRGGVTMWPHLHQRQAVGLARCGRR